MQTNEQMKHAIEKAENIFLNPGKLYRWEDVIAGPLIPSRTGLVRRIPAVAQNTWRGFHRKNKNKDGAAVIFQNFFLRNKSDLIQKIKACKSPKDLQSLSNALVKRIESKLTNIEDHQLRPYNKVRFPVDLYMEYLVSTSQELNLHRNALVPILNLPLGNGVFRSLNIFSEPEISSESLGRGSSFGDVKSEETYQRLQNVLRVNAKLVAQKFTKTFHPIYYDIFWNNRHLNPGNNLFEIIDD